ncbi:cytochrome P450 [Schizophyllum commune H4-8]|nr:cytochrome P450 [Schizophyllum commune H4-8]KAI5887518.1 cytochrome P450 [Schizophyllum commune H4-8]
MLYTLVQNALLCALLYGLYKRLRLFSNKLPSPPGPPAEPLLGHIRIAPQQAAERTYFRWSKEYKSELIHINVLGQPIIVIHSLPAAVELLEKRSAINSDRPSFAFFDMLGWYECLVLLRYNHPSFPILRREYAKHFAKGAERRIYGLQVNEAHKLVKRIVERPEQWRDYLKLFSTAVIMQINTGHEVKDVDDVYVSIANDVCTTITEGGPPGATGIDLCPLLRYLPSWCDPTGSAAFARKMRYAVKNMHDVPYERVKKEIDAGTAQPSFMLSLIQAKDAQENGGPDLGLTRERIQGLCATGFAAGMDTTLDTLTTFVFAIVNHPEVQERAREELHAVVGLDRLPEMEDRPNLPYVERVVQETFRFWPSAPLGAPHKSMEDDVYEGMFIPKGSVLVTNVFAMGHDENIYADPWKFDPDRYLSTEKGGRGEPLPVGQFGFGRRACPGRLVGEASVFIVIATMLHVLSLDKARDENGEEITIDPQTAMYTTGLTSHPETVLCNIVPASERAGRLAKEAYAD